MAAVIVAAVADSQMVGADVSVQLEGAARRAAPELVGSWALVDAGHLYKVVIDPRPTRGWDVIDMAALADVLYRAFVQDPDDPLWRDYEAHRAAIEHARPRLHPLLGVLLRRTPSLSPAGLEAIRETSAALLAHRRTD